MGVFGIVRDDKNHVLLCLRTDYDLWNLPGGRLEKGETPWQGVIREVKEEAGLEVEVVRLIGVYSKPEKDEVVFSFECKIIGGEILLNAEAKAIQYFSSDDLPENIPPKQRERIEDLFVNKKEVVLKIQVGKSTLELMSGKTCEK